MSSHREAPEISKDPVADNTDTYAFVSPDQPDTVTLIANFIPLQQPEGGPNFYEFGDDVLYEIHISNRGDAHADLLGNPGRSLRSLAAARFRTQGPAGQCRRAQYAELRPGLHRRRHPPP